MSDRMEKLQALREADEKALEDAARREVKEAVEAWFTDVGLDDMFKVKGWAL